MLNKYSYLFFIPLIAVIVNQYSGCDSDTVNNIINNPTEFEGYDPEEAGTMMTLSALCYVAEGNTNALEVRDSIELQLANVNYSTGGNWHVCWGPGISPSGGNLMYVARDTSTGSDTIYYAICVRGTIFNLADIEEDLDVFYLEPWPYGNAGDSVSYGSLEGFDTLLNTFDPVTNQSLNAFLSGLQVSRKKMFITGHSLGGAMATLMTSWFVESFPNSFKVETYTFAAPTVGNITFAASFNSKMSSINAQNHRCVNTKDVVPYAWADLPSIYNNNIPTTVPPFIRAVLQTVYQYMKDSIIYKHVETRVPLGPPPDPTNCGAIGWDSTYRCWVGYEHASNTYLRLLNADTIIWGRR